MDVATQRWIQVVVATHMWVKVVMAIQRGGFKLLWWLRKVRIKCCGDSKEGKKWGRKRKELEGKKTRIFIFFKLGDGKREKRSRWKERKEWEKEGKEKKVSASKFGHS